jgi:hypothetical protein
VEFADIDVVRGVFETNVFGALAFMKVPPMIYLDAPASPSIRLGTGSR